LKFEEKGGGKIFRHRLISIFAKSSG